MGIGNYIAGIASNRTMLELKSDGDYVMGTALTSNRTMLELKLPQINMSDATPGSSNRTMLELKFFPIPKSSLNNLLVIAPCWN